MGSHAHLFGLAKMIMRTQLGPNNDVSFYQPSLTSFMDYLPPLSPCKRTQHCWPTTPNIVECYMLRPFANPVACCWMLLSVVTQSLKPVKLFSQQLPTLLLFRDRRSVAQQCLIRLHSSSNIVAATHAHYAWITEIKGCILPTMHCRSQSCWELLHPFAHHCQHARNNSQHCYATMMGVGAPVCMQP